MLGMICRMLGINNLKTSFIIFKNGGGTLLFEMKFAKNRAKIKVLTKSFLQ